MSRRAPQIRADDGPERVWYLALADGTVRESLSLPNVRSLLEVGVATADSHILRLGDTAWVRLGDHPVWPEVAPPTTTARFVAPVAVDPGVQSNQVHTATPRMQAIWQEQREIQQAKLQERNLQEDHGRFLQALGFACGVAGLICVGDIIVFTCSLGLAFMLLVGVVRLLSLWLVWRVLR